MDWPPEIIAASPWLPQLFDTLKPVVGDVYRLLWSGIRTKQKTSELKNLTQAMIEAQNTAPHADISYGKGDWSITMPAVPIESALTPETQMRLKLDQRRYKALGGVVAEAVFEVKDETCFPSAFPAEDWVSRFVEAASQVSDQKMQELWGRILAGEIKRPGSFSLRTLHVVSTLSESEAKGFEKHAKNVFRWKNFKLIQNIDRHALGLLADCGLLLESPLELELMTPDEDQAFFEFGKNRMVILHRGVSVTMFLKAEFWTLTTAGVELLALIEREAEPSSIRSLLNILGSPPYKGNFGGRVGSYTLTNEGKEIIFVPDIKYTYGEASQLKYSVQTPSGND